MSLRTPWWVSDPRVFVIFFIFSALAPEIGSAADLKLRFTHRAFLAAKHGDTLLFECSGLPVLRTTDIAVEEYCGNAPTVGFDEQVYVASQPALEGFRSRMTCTFSARDTCGKTATLTIHMLVVDRIPPQLENVPPDVVLKNGAPLPSPPPVFAVDNCTRTIEVAYRQDSTWLEIEGAQQLEYRRYWTAEDEAGNVAADSQRISREGTTEVDPCATQSFAGIPNQISTYACDGGAEICLAVGPGSLLSLGGKTLTSAEACPATSYVGYSLAEITSASLTGSIEVVWRVSPGVYRARLQSADSLLGFLQRSVPEGGWRLTSRDTLAGLSSSQYGTITIVESASGRVITISPMTYAGAPTARYVLPVGSHLLTLTKGECRDTVAVEVVCAPTQERRVTVVSGLLGTHCVQAPAPADTYQWTRLQSPDTAIVSELSVTALCFEFQGARTGQTRALFERCHVPTGSCERIALNITVISARQVQAPTLQPDVVALAYNGQLMIEVLLNDTYVGEITSLRVTGVPQGDVRVDSRDRLHYTAPRDWCGEDNFGYIACNEGGCRETEVKVQVACDKLIVFSGMSPNGDGVNDAFTVLGIENYATNKLAVFNQHGLEVYHTESYANNWLGDSNGTPLTDGTYYYVLEVEGFDTLSGYLQIRR